MATAKKTETAPKATKEEKVEKAPETPVVKSNKVRIKIDRVPGVKEQEDVVIEVNGKRWQIQRGVEVEVPKKVAAAIRQWRRECADAEALVFELMN